MANKLSLLEPNDAEFNMHHRRNETIVGKKVEIGAARVADEFYDCEFIDCEIRIKCAGHATGVILAHSTFVNCLIWPSKKQIITHIKARFAGCEFKGRYECRFHGEIVDCSFLNAKLDWTTFHHPVDLERLQLPPWPHIVIKDCRKHYATLNSLIPKWNYAASFDETHAIVVNINDLSDTPEGTWKSIKDLPYVTSSQGA